MAQLVNGHIELTSDEFMEADDGMIGYCLNCGDEYSPIEPDGRDVTCEGCGEPRVFGVSELLIMGLISLVD